MQLCECSYIFETIRARHEIGDFVLLEDFITVTQRLTFPGSATGKRFGKECNDDRAVTNQ